MKQTILLATSLANIAAGTFISHITFKAPNTGDYLYDVSTDTFYEVLRTVLFSNDGEETKFVYLVKVVAP